MKSILQNNVLPLYFETKDQNDNLIKERLGTGFVIGSLGKFILVATALHIFKDIEGLIKYLDGSKKLNLSHIPPNDDEGIETKDIGRHEIIGYITINKYGEQVRCLMDGIFGSNNNTSDVSLMAMRIDHDEYIHVNPLTISLNLLEKDIGKTAYIYSFSENTTNLIDDNKKLYKTTAVLNENEGKITLIYNEPKKNIETPSFSLDAPSHGGNSGGLIYRIENDIPIACGIISHSSSESSIDNTGNGYTIGIQFAHMMRYSYKKAANNDNPLLRIDKMPYLLSFVVHGIINIVESEFLINIKDNKKIGVQLKEGKYIPIS
ncbi:hypothetical protein [Aliarcobacter butzleri]|uniref:hypothetical protein n=1 Tax=Aliarcobacter butzleri TaxID=28197 RepID=UPI001917C57D|nr:hypothetical protein [Aliarcobacter butzleri]